MIDVVVDTNIILSALMTRGRVRRTFFHQDLRPHAPRRIVEETLRHAGKVSRYTGIPEDALRPIMRLALTTWTTIHSEEQIPETIKAEAKRITASLDPDDWPFVALAMYLGVPLWTGDRRLLEHAVEAGFRHYRAVDTHAVEMLLEGRSWGEVEEYLQRKYGRGEL